MAKKWNDIRASWVNGNRQEAKEAIYQQSKLAMLITIKEAIETAHELNYQSGDLVDLHEILKSFSL